ncbi:hypothetical protein [Salinactinospora qingdaonensis]|uniref:hypothetical protein n=1 Tax=Salinactinospora qingdaonensis TaxID=702744 RepID=UPI0031F19C4C
MTEPPELGDYAQGQAHALMVQALESAAEEGVTYSGDPVLNPEVISLAPEENPTTADIEDCADGSAWIPAENRTDSQIKPRRIEATASYDGLVWRVSEMRIWEPGSCD